MNYPNQELYKQTHKDYGAICELAVLQTAYLRFSSMANTLNKGPIQNYA